MTPGDDRDETAKAANQGTLGGDPLSPPLTVQESSTTRDVVTKLRHWATGQGQFEHCVISGPPGSGRTHLLEALAGTLRRDEMLLCAPTDPDWQSAIAYIESNEGRRLLIDDFDRYDAAFLKQLLAKAANGNHRIVAVMSTFEGRLRRLWDAHLSQASDVRLGSVNERLEDVAAFLPHWGRIAGHAFPEGRSFTETVRLLVAMKLPRGFADLTRILEDVVVGGAPFWDPPDATVLIGAYARTVLGPRTALPAILVEGHTDAIYLQWVSELATGSSPADVEVEPCQSASRIPQRAFACRNEGRRCVALFDHDGVGKRLHDQMKEFRLGSVVISAQYDPLAGYATEHIPQIIEIEDLLPLTQIERFITQTGRVPELVIDVPRLRLRRIVIHTEDKLELARWVHTNLGADSAERLLDLYNVLRQKLDLAKVSIRSPPAPKQRSQG